jgi:selenocysteine-specific elongation factor
VGAVLDDADGVVRTATTVRMKTHRVALDDRGDEVERLRAAVGGDHAAAPPSVADLVAAGFPRDLIDAAGRQGAVVPITRDLVVHPDLVARATALIDANADDGVTVSALREELGTSRKFAVPLVEWMDAQGLTRRVGDLRFPRSSGETAPR